MGFCSRNCSKCNCSGRRAEAAFPLSTAASWESWQSHHHAATVLLRCMGSQWHFWRGLSGRSCSSDIFQSIQLFSPSQKFGKPFSAVCPAPSLLKATDKNGVSKIALIVRRFEKKKSAKCNVMENTPTERLPTFYEQTLLIAAVFIYSTGLKCICLLSVV